MEFLFLGTGATEGIPSVFCGCRLCCLARTSGGVEIRRRASVLINGEFLVDLPPDLFNQALLYKLELQNIRCIAITHTHNDHFYPQELRNMRAPYSIGRDGAPVSMLGSSDVKRALIENLGEDELARMGGLLRFETARAFVPMETNGYVVTPLRARHCSGAFIYLIEHGGKTLLYANDTGFFPEETWDFLRGVKIDAAILDCNNPINSDTYNHMTIDDNITVTHRLFQQRSATNDTRFIATHFSHNSGLTHRQIFERLELYSIEAAYDGMKVKL